MKLLFFQILDVHDVIELFEPNLHKSVRTLLLELINAFLLQIAARMYGSSTESGGIHLVFDISCPMCNEHSLDLFLYSAGPTADSLKQWLVVFEGEQGSLYEGGTFFALLTFDDDYPFTPPTVSILANVDGHFRSSGFCLA